MSLSPAAYNAWKRRNGVTVGTAADPHNQSVAARMLLAPAPGQPGAAPRAQPPARAPAPISPERRRFLAEQQAFRPSYQQAQRDTWWLAVPALAPAAVPVAMELGLPGAAAALRGAAISGRMGAAVEAGRQVVVSPRHRITDPKAVVMAGMKSTISGGPSSAGGRLFGAPGAAAGTFAGSKAAGASDREAAFSAAGAFLGHVLLPNRAGDKGGAQVARQVYRSLVGKLAAKGADDALGHDRRRGH